MFSKESCKIDANHLYSFGTKLIKIMLGNMLAGGPVVWPIVKQYFHELNRGLGEKTISTAEALPIYLVLAPSILSLGLMYKTIRKIKKDDDLHG